MPSLVARRSRLPVRVGVEEAEPPWQRRLRLLFDISRDPEEQPDLANAEPLRAAEIERCLTPT